MTNASLSNHLTDTMLCARRALSIKTDDQYSLDDVDAYIDGAEARIDAYAAACYDDCSPANLRETNDTTADCETWGLTLDQERQGVARALAMFAEDTKMKTLNEIDFERMLASESSGKARGEEMVFEFSRELSTEEIETARRVGLNFEPGCNHGYQYTAIFQE